MKYLLMVRIDDSVEIPAESVTAAKTWAENMQDRGVRVIGDRLRPSSEATIVQMRDGDLLVSEGPFAETKEQMAGFEVLDCADLDEAIEVASQHPGANLGTVELRPLWYL